MTEKLGPDHYRYFATLDHRGAQINCERFIVIGETPRCWYVLPATRAHLLNKGMGWAREAILKHRRRVLKTSHGRRYCYPDKAHALESFITRQKWRIHHAKRSLSVAELTLARAQQLMEAKAMPAVGVGIPCGHDEYTASLRWEGVDSDYDY